MTEKKKSVRKERLAKPPKPPAPRPARPSASPTVESPLAARCQELMVAAGYRTIQAMALRGEELGFTPSPRKDSSSLYASFHSLGTGFRNTKLGVLFRWWVVLKHGNPPPEDAVFQELFALWCEQQIAVARRKARAEGLDVPLMDKFGFYGRLAELAGPQSKSEKELLDNYRLLAGTPQKIVRELAAAPNDSKSWSLIRDLLRITKEASPSVEASVMSD